MLKIAIVGASGYTGVELARLLHSHPKVELVAATSRQYDGQSLSEVFPNLRECADIICKNHPPEEIADLADFIFCAVPHKTAMNIVPLFLQSDRKVVDLSADFRLKDVNTYEDWYQPHSSPDLLSEAVYGLPELYRSQIVKARLVANPGCYPTSIILGLNPLLKDTVISPETIIVDSKSGTSGAGRAAAVGTLFCEVTDGFRPYKVGGVHRHIPEIEQELSGISGTDVTVSFTPHLLPISRGILSTIYASLSLETSEEHLITLFKDTYKDHRFVRVLPAGQVPATQHVRGSNYCDIGVSIDRRTNRVIITTAIDNIVKGASGQAVQNMNIMCGLPEETGLDHAPFFP